MIKIPGYTVTRQLSQGKYFCTYQAIRVSDQKKVILKGCRSEQPSIQEITALKNEYHLLKQLHIPQVIKAYELVKNKHQLILVLEDIEGISLKEYLNKHPISVANFLTIALQLSEAIHALHVQNIIHKDINPNNIIIEPKTLTVKLIDFSISSQLTQDTSAAIPEYLEGTLSYLSPEQTGRMNAVVDYRADFYSLGVTFYEMLAGKLPFESNDLLELIYSHLAKTPTPIEIVKPQIPKVLSDIVAKLMAKLPEARYASISGLKADLVECQFQWQTRERIEPFILGQHDFSEQLTLSQKLYGREDQVNELLDTFTQVSEQGSNKLLLVSGYSGIGKTSLVKELYKPITRDHGYFVSGKFDQLQRTTPYSAIIEAFTDLVRRLLAEPQERLSQLRTSFLAALGENSQLLIDIIPNLALILGEQAKPAELSIEQTQPRFLLAFSEFVRVVATSDHPLVVFIDDLQWADSASLQLLNQLVTDTKLSHFLLIGAYRDNEVTLDHPLMLMLQEFNKNKVAFHNLTLKPLHINAIGQMLMDSFGGEMEAAMALAELTHYKTQGNPYFINEFIKLLYKQKLLYFSQKRRQWEWDIANIEAQNITDNVVDLLLSRLRDLPDASQRVLSLAACMGHTFDLQGLSIINEQSLLSTAHSLWLAIQAQFIKPLANSYRLVQSLEKEDDIDLSVLTDKVQYQFIHDRIQQAAYQLIPEAVKQETHLRIARLLLKDQALDEHDKRLFDIVNHFNQGLLISNDPAERLAFAQYNLWAGRKAVQSNAYQAAASYITSGIALLPDDPWNKYYDLTFALYKVKAECSYLLGQHDIAESTIDNLLHQAKSPLEAADIYTINIAMLTTLKHHAQALDVGLAALAKLGVKLPAKPKPWHIVAGMLAVKWQIGRADIATFNLPPMADPKQRMIDKLMLQLVNIAYFLDQNLFALLIYKSCALNLKYGYTENFAFICALHGLISLHGFKLYKEGYDFVALSEKIAGLLPASAAISRQQLTLGCFVMHYKYPAAKSLEYLQRGYQFGLDAGDVVYAFYNLVHQLLLSFPLGKPLPELTLSIKAVSSFKAKYQINEFNTEKFFIDYFHILQGNSLSVAPELPELDQTHNTEISFVYNYYIILYYLARDFNKALEYCKINESYVEHILGTLSHPQNQFMHALTLTSNYTNVDTKQQRIYTRKIKSLHRELKRWAKWCPINYLQYDLLISAEWARIKQDNHLAGELYDQAIRAAHDCECLHILGITNECAAHFYLGLDKPHFAKIYIQAAHYAFEKWGAYAKCIALEQAYPDWLQSGNGSKGVNTYQSLTTQRHTSTDTSLASIDVLSILKSAQVISSEIQLDKLLQKLLCILLENAAAQRGILIMKEHGHWFVKAEGTIAAQQVALNSKQQAYERDDIPLSLVQYVQRTQEQVLIQNPEDFQAHYLVDSYLEQVKPKSILILPVRYQNELSCLFYLENKDISCAFTQENIQTLQLLASQAAISLENAQLYYQATHDNLTGLANRNLLYHLYHRAQARAKRDNTLIAILFLDLDGFKKINDTLGHEAGDEVLIHFADQIRLCPRETDLAVRLGGDEFVVMMEGLRDVTPARLFAERFLQQLKIPVQLAEQRVTMATSIGISIYPQNGSDIQTLLKQADIALYRVKQAGKNHYQFYTPSLNPK